MISNFANNGLYEECLNIFLKMHCGVGDGKSIVVLHFVEGQIMEFQEPTIGVAFFSQTLDVKFDVWDAVGREGYHSLTPRYYRGAAAAIIVYDITNQASFERAKKWVQELQAQGNPNMVMALAGNNLELLDTRKVDNSQFNEEAVKLEFDGFVDFGGDNSNTNAHLLTRNCRCKKSFAPYIFDVLPVKGFLWPFDRGK
ncbi:hypothetical protein F2P56_028319 [Juglans regia]|uniref:Ras-related protein RHN1-like n=1 Tax=Juglans regia TaxID=51240 RepID=A0A833X1X4_JUGRE|nr:hypothetical protein F2P56_028319 [Juglans regia]